MSQSKAYTRELRDETGYTPTWLPSVPLELGTVGRLDGYVFLPVTTLKQLGIPFTPSVRGAKTDISYTSQNAVSVATKVAGELPAAGSSLAQADAGLIVSFRRENAILFLGSKCSTSYIADQDKVEEAILDAYEKGTWKPKYVAVTELVTAETATILISSGSQATIEFRASVAGTVPSLGLLGVRGGVSFGRESAIGIRLVAEETLTPLFRAIGVRKGIFGPDTVVRCRMVGTNEAVWVAHDLAYDDFAREDGESV